MIVSVGVLLWTVPFFALLVGYWYGKGQLDPDIWEGFIHYRSKD